jgi:hypothetical protein
MGTTQRSSFNASAATAADFDTLRRSFSDASESAELQHNACIVAKPLHFPALTPEGKPLFDIGNMLLKRVGKHLPARPPRSTALDAAVKASCLERLAEFAEAADR